MTLSTEIILAASAVVFGAVNALLFIINMIAIRKSGENQKKFIVKLSMAILKAKKEGDFRALEELLDDKKKKKQSAPEEPPKKDDDAVFTGSLNGAMISVDFTKYAPPSGKKEARREARTLFRALMQRFVLFRCARLFQAKTREAAGLRIKKVAMEKEVERISMHCDAISRGDVEIGPEDYRDLLLEKVTAQRAVQRCTEEAAAAQLKCESLALKYKAIKEHMLPLSNESYTNALLLEQQGIEAPPPPPNA